MENTDGLVAEMRRSYEALADSAGALEPLAERRDVTVMTAHGPVPVQLNRPRASGVLPVVVFVHGGGFVSGSLHTHEVLVSALANRSGALLVAVEYTLAPEARFPVQQEQVAAVLDWVRAQADELRIDPGRIALAGDSAGGTIAAGVAQSLLARGDEPLRALLLLYPALVPPEPLTPSRRELGEQYFPQNELQATLAELYAPEPGGGSPWPALNAVRGLPPTRLFVGEHDPMRDESLDFAAAIRAAGGAATATVTPGAEHGYVQFFQQRGQHPGGEAALTAAVEFLLAAFAADDGAAAPLSS